MQKMSDVQRLITNFSNKKLLVTGTKDLNDVLFAGELDNLKPITFYVRKSIKLGAIVYGPARLEYKGLHIEQFDSILVKIRAKMGLEQKQRRN